MDLPLKKENCIQTRFKIEENIAELHKK